MKRKIILHGSLRQLYPAGFIELEADTVAEALNGMSKILKIKPDIWTGRPTYKVLHCDTVESLVGENPLVDLHVIPALTGSGNIVRIVVGAILVVVGIVTENPMLISVGLGLAIGGLMGLLFPAKQETPGSQQDRYLDASGNTTAIGTRIPLLFGEAQAYGQVLSYNVDSSDIDGGTGDGSRWSLGDDRVVYT